MHILIDDVEIVPVFPKQLTFRVEVILGIICLSKVMLALVYRVVKTRKHTTELYSWEENIQLMFVMQTILSY